MSESIQWIFLGLPAFILAGTVHEYMHAWTAKKLGDDTATTAGRLTLNPLAHLDPLGTFLMIVARFGWMRPIPINEYNFENPVRGTAITALAGPVSNLVMAIIGGGIFRLMMLLNPESNSSPSLFATFLFIFVWVNVALMLFNLIPLPPLDGSRIIRAFLPLNIRYYLELAEQYAPFIILLIFLPISPLSRFTITLLSEGVMFFVQRLLF